MYRLCVRKTKSRALGTRRTQVRRIVALAYLRYRLRTTASQRVRPAEPAPNYSMGSGYSISIKIYTIQQILYQVRCKQPAKLARLYEGKIRGNPIITADCETSTPLQYRPADTYHELLLSPAFVSPSSVALPMDRTMRKARPQCSGQSTTPSINPPTRRGYTRQHCYPFRSTPQRQRL